MAIPNFPNPNPSSGFGTKMAQITPTLVLGQVIMSQDTTKYSLQIPNTPARYYCPGMALASNPSTGVVREAFTVDNILGVIMQSARDGTVIVGTADSTVESMQPYQNGDLVNVAGNGNTIVMVSAGAILQGAPVVYWPSSQSTDPYKSTVAYGQVVSINDATNIAIMGTGAVPFGVAMETVTAGSLVKIQLTGTPSSNINNAL